MPTTAPSLRSGKHRLVGGFEASVFDLIQKNPAIDSVDVATRDERLEGGATIAREIKVEIPLHSNVQLLVVR